MIKVNTLKNDTVVEIKGKSKDIENELTYLIEALFIEKVSMPSDIFTSLYAGFGNEFRDLCKIVLNNPNLTTEALEEVIKEGEENESN